MTLEMLVSAALMDYSQSEQTKILKAIEEDKLPTTKRLHNGVMKVMEVFPKCFPLSIAPGAMPIAISPTSSFGTWRNLRRLLFP